MLSRSIPKLKQEKNEFNSLPPSFNEKEENKIEKKEERIKHGKEEESIPIPIPIITTTTIREEDEFIAELSSEILVLIFSFLDISSLSNASRVSLYWNQLINDDLIWKEKMNEKKELFYSNQLIGREGHWKKLFKDVKELNLQKSKFPSIIHSGFESSSMDDPSQDISQTLELSESTFWSSKGSSDISSGEYLIYKLTQPLCIITSVSILPYQAYYQQGCPIYSPQSMQVSVGISPNSFHWKSPILPITNTRTMKRMEIAPFMAVGGYIRIDLYGRYQTQMQDDLYYTVLEFVSAEGFLIGEIDSQTEIPYSMYQFAMKEKKELFIGNIQEHIQDDISDEDDLFETFTNFCQAELEPCLEEDKLKRKEGRDFQEAFRSKDFDNAIQIAIKSQKGHLRTRETINLLKSGGPAVFRKFLQQLYQHPGRLNKWESLEFCSEFLSDDPSKYIAIIALALVRNKFCITQELGDMMMDYDVTIALNIYQLLSIPDKIINCLILLKCYKRLVAFCIAYNYRFDFLELLKKLQQQAPFQAIKFAIALCEARGGPPVDMDQAFKILGLTKDPLEWDYKKLLLQRLESVQCEPSTTNTFFSSADDEGFEYEEED